MRRLGIRCWRRRVLLIRSSSRVPVIGRVGGNFSGKPRGAVDITGISTRTMDIRKSYGFVPCIRRPGHGLVLGRCQNESGRLVAQRPVDEKSNEITALRPMLEAVPLERVIVTADAMHAQQEAAHFLTQEKGADDLFTLKGNQPSVQDKALQLLGSAFPPSTQGASSDAGERTWASRTSRVVGASGHP